MGRPTLSLLETYYVIQPHLETRKYNGLLYRVRTKLILGFRRSPSQGCEGTLSMSHSNINNELGSVLEGIAAREARKAPFKLSGRGHEARMSLGNPPFFNRLQK